MGFGVFFLPLVGGYLFLKYSNFTRFLIARQSGYNLLLESAHAGFWLLLAARVVLLFIGFLSDNIDFLSEELDSIGRAWSDFSPVNYSGTAVVALLLGPVAAKLSNRFRTPDKAVLRAVNEAGNAMEELFLESMKLRSLVEVTLQNGKVYVGWVLRADLGSRDRKCVQIHPLSSGYRDDESRKIILNTSYAEVYVKHSRKLGSEYEEKFRIVVPVEEIRSARPFDVVHYRWFMEDPTAAPAP